MFVIFDDFRGNPVAVNSDKISNVTEGANGICFLWTDPGEYDKRLAIKGSLVAITKKLNGCDEKNVL